MEVEFFDSLEEAQARIEEAMRAADARVRPWQAVIEPGEFFVTVAEDGLVIFGQVLEGYADARLRHYRFCRCYSVACPEGELGDVHVSTIWRLISREEFESAHQAGWVVGEPEADRGAADRGAAETPPPRPGPSCPGLAASLSRCMRSPEVSTRREGSGSVLLDQALEHVGVADLGRDAAVLVGMDADEPEGLVGARAQRIVYAVGKTLGHGGLEIEVQLLDLFRRQVGGPAHPDCAHRVGTD